MRLTKWYLMAFLCLGAHFCSGASVDSKSPAQFFLRPETPAELVFSTSSEEDLAWTLENWNGEPVGNGKTQVAEGVVRLSLKLPAGFYLLRIAGQRFGLFSVAEFSGEPDPFFGVDAALSWLLVNRKMYREDLVRILAENGIRRARERIWLADLVPSAGVFNRSGGKRDYANLREIYQKYNIELLEVSHDAPAWMKKKEGKYPDDLNAYEEAWRKIAGAFGKNWCGLEIWNEPDIGFGGNLPAEYYMPVVKAMAFAFADRSDLPLLGGVLTERCPESFWETCLESGFTELVDGLSLHHYSRGESMGAMISKYRKGGFPLPIHITEAGSHYPDDGTYRNLPASRQAALENVIKASEAKAFGAASFYLFVYASYFESGRSFSMWSAQYAPMPELAAYFVLCRELANRNNQGNYRGQRVFANTSGQAVVLLRSGGPLPMKAVYVGIDGRRINATEVADVLARDGLVYAKLPLADLAGELSKNPVISPVPGNDRKRSVPSPVILAPNLKLRGPGFLIAKDGITLDSAAEQFEYQLNAINLSNRETKLKLSVELPWTGVTPPAQEVLIPPHGQCQVTFFLRLPESPATDKVYYLKFRGEYDGTAPVLPLVSAIHFSAQGLKEGLIGADKIVEIPLADASKWRKNFSGKGEWNLYFSPRQTLCCEVDYTENGSHWFYPEFTLKERPPTGSRLLLRYRATIDGTSHFYAQVRDNKGRVYLSGQLNPVDGNWYKVLLLASDFTCHYPAAERGRKLDDLGQVTHLMMGQSILSGRKATLELSDLLFYTK